MSALAQDVAGVDWYHTIDLPGDIVTPGHLDNRPSLARMPLPASLHGKRCLDIGTWDGFWAFEMERRGAAEVVALDVDDSRRWDWPGSAPHQKIELFRARKHGRTSFEIAHGALGSSVHRIDASVYDLSPAEFGEFDFVFMGSLLLHLQDPGRALTAIRSVTRGEFLSNDTISLLLSILRPRTPTAELYALDEPRWWTPNVAGLKRLVRSGGFDIVSSGRPYFVPWGDGYQAPGLRLRQLAAHNVTHMLGHLTRLGVPHMWILARPTR